MSRSAASSIFKFIKIIIHFIDINNIELYIHFVKDHQPSWLEVLDEEDLQFLKRFLLSSGSLKAMCDEYGVSYPTLRARLDRLIAKVQAAEDPKITDAFQRKLHVLVADGKLSPTIAKELWKAHRTVAQLTEERMKYLAKTLD
jgi:hypothetical protein